MNAGFGIEARSCAFIGTNCDGSISIGIGCDIDASNADYIRARIFNSLNR